MRGRRGPGLAAAVAGLLVLTACTGPQGPPAASPEPSGVTPPAASASPEPSGVTTASSGAGSLGDDGTASASAAAPRVTGVAVAESIRGFDHPWEVRFLPDGTPLVTERVGRVSAIVDGRRRVLADVPRVVAQGEGGLMGMAVDPGFTRNRRIYLCHTAGSGNRAVDVRVVRFRVAADLDDLTERTPIVTGIPAGAGNRHQGCRLEIGPDGMLWISAGDAVLPSAPQDPRSRAGKVLRATLGGEPASDNPGGDWDPYVYTLGHRNVQGLAFRPADGAAFSVEHGTSCDDEINILSPGANYGWDPRRADGGYAEQAPMTSPDVRGAVPAVWSSGCPTIAPSGAAFITGAQWGSWAGRLAVAVLKDQELLVARVADDEVTSTRTFLSGELGRLRTVRTGPDGSLWVATDADAGRVVRLVPQTDGG